MGAFSNGRPQSAGGTGQLSWRGGLSNMASAPNPLMQGGAFPGAPPRASQLPPPPPVRGYGGGGYGALAQAGRASSGMGGMGSGRGEGYWGPKPGGGGGSIGGHAGDKRKYPGSDDVWKPNDTAGKVGKQPKLPKVLQEKAPAKVAERHQGWLAVASPAPSRHRRASGYRRHAPRLRRGAPGGSTRRGRDT